MAKKLFLLFYSLGLLFVHILCTVKKTNLNLLIKNLIIEGWMMKRTGTLTITIMITDTDYVLLFN